MTRHRFHVVALPNSTTSRSSNWCAYQSKVYKFCKMMSQRGHEVYHYGVDESNPTCIESVPILSFPEMVDFFGNHDPNKTYSLIKFDTALPYWQLANYRAAKEIKARYTKGDYVCLIGGTAQKPIADKLAKLPVMSVEYGIGYYGTFAKYRVFESYAHQANVYGRSSNDPNGNFFDAVVPNYFDTSDFTIQTKPGTYALFVGRMVQRKGLEIAVEATRRAGMRLVMCGQGVKTVVGNTIVAEDGRSYTGDHLEYVGVADVAMRDKLMGGAVALLAPTIYLEPFGGVAVEAQMCGTPAITTDWGAFPETVQHGVTGYRCRTLEQFVWALQNAAKLDRVAVAERARANYSLERVGAMYDEYFSMLSTLWGDGWYADRRRESLDWLRAS